MLLLCVVVGGGGTRGVCLRGEDDSARSTFVYVSSESPREDSGSQARRKDEALVVLVEDEEVGRSAASVGEDFCWIRAMKPEMLSLDDGVGWTYTCHSRMSYLVASSVEDSTLLLENSSLTPFPDVLCMMVLYSPSSSSLKS